VEHWLILSDKTGSDIVHHFLGIFIHKGSETVPPGELRFSAYYYWRFFDRDLSLTKSYFVCYNIYVAPLLLAKLGFSPGGKRMKNGTNIKDTSVRDNLYP